MGRLQEERLYAQSHHPFHVFCGTEELSPIFDHFVKKCPGSCVSQPDASRILQLGALGLSRPEVPKTALQADHFCEAFITCTECGQASSAQTHLLQACKLG